MRIVIAAAVLSASFGSAAAAQDRPAAYANAEACLEAKVDQAVAASTGAADAADFLLGYLCAGPVAAAVKYEVNSDLLASGKGLVEGVMAMSPGEGADEDMPDFDAMSEEELDAWIKAQEAEAAAAVADAEAEGRTTAFSLDDAQDAAPVGAPFEGISVDPVTGEVVTGDNPIGPFVVAFLDYMDATARTMSHTPPVFLRERAAELIVQRRGR